MTLKRWMRASPALLALAMAIALSIDLPAPAADALSERERLTAILRQLDVIERTAQQGAEVASLEGRYHFDYLRLHADIERIRAGIRDYLTPLRAQPRDAQELSGEYRRAKDGAP